MLGLSAFYQITLPVLPPAAEPLLHLMSPKPQPGRASKAAPDLQPLRPIRTNGQIPKIQKGGASHLCIATTPSAPSVILATFQPQADAHSLDVDLNLVAHAIMDT